MINLSDIQSKGWEYGINKVINADCLELMKEMPDNSIDLVVADPPYLQDSHGGGGAFGVRMRDYHKGVDSLGMGFEDIVLTKIKRIMKKINIYCFCSKNQLLQILSFFKDYNYDVLTYHKTNPCPTCNNKYLSDTEYIIYVREKGVKLYGTYETKKKYFIQENGKSEFEHPTVKPKNIIKTLIDNSSRENDLIFDPFMGSGTTARACIDLNRRFYGAEISKEYCSIWEDRIKQQVLI